MEFSEVIRARRSVRRFLPREIPDDVLTELLDAGRLAPAINNAPNFVFGVVRDGATKKELAKAAGGQEWVADAPVVIAHCARLGADLALMPEDEMTLKVNRVRFGADLISYLNAYPDRRAMRVLLENGTVMMAGEQVFLAAVNRGLRACWVGYLDTRRASEILRLPDDMVCLFLMPVGYPAETPEERTVRPLEEFVFYDSWDAGPSARQADQPADQS